MAALRSRLTDLAASFTEAVIDAIRSTSLDELLRESGNHRPSPRVTASGATASSAPARKGPKRAAAFSSSGRLQRRSLEAIGEELDKVVALVQTNKEGLRAEQIRVALGMQAKELPRVLKEGLASKRLRTRGQKRATTYFAR